MRWTMGQLKRVVGVSRERTNRMPRWDPFEIGEVVGGKKIAQSGAPFGLFIPRRPGLMAH